MQSSTVGALGVVRPSRDEFRDLAADRRVIPVVRTLLADAETPVGLYRKLAADRSGTFLFESAENGQSWSRWSFIGVRSPATLTVRDGQAVWRGTTPVGLPTEGNPLEVLRATIEALHTEPLPDLPPLTGGMVGYIGYDAVRWLERLPELADDDLQLPELMMLLATDLAAFDHHEGTVTLIANAVNWDDSPKRVDAAYDDAVSRLDAMTDELATHAQPTAAAFRRPEPEFVRRRDKSDYHKAVLEAVEAIHAGEAFQVVPSQRFEMTTGADALDVYRVLRATNPSPYMYLLRMEGFDIVSSSPEALVTVRDGRATTHPIAGTRWRGQDPDEDALLAKDLLADDKERAEHLMLVDLGRNDLGRVCKPGTVHVVDSFTIERYSHVMHIVSTVTGELAEGRTAFDAVAACFPAGTLTGAPKVRAMELIEELEPTRRGLYGGVAGYFDFAGDADMAIAIRTALMRDGVAYVQAGGGVVADSQPEYEDNESLNKARTVLVAGPLADPPRPSEARARRPLWTAVGMLLPGAVALWGSSRMVWSAELVDGGVRGPVELEQPGADVAPQVVGLALLALAGIAGVVATSGWPRRVVGALLGVAGAAVAVTVLATALDDQALRGGHIVALLGALLVASAGVLSVAWARRGVRMPADDIGRADAPAADSGELWDALSAGEDPTERD